MAQTREEKLRKKREAYLKDPEKMRLRHRDWIAKNPERAKELRNKSYRKTYTKARYAESVRRSFLKKKYGLTMEDYNSRRMSVGYRCEICGTHESKLKRKLSVDHDHDTGKVRGLLCTKCNMGMGYFNDKIVHMMLALDYLKNRTI